VETLVATPGTIKVEPKGLHDVWAFVKQGLDEVIKKTKPEWIAEDIYTALSTGHATLFVSFSDQKPIGYTITYFSPIAFTQQRELFIWVAWTIKPAQRTSEDDVDAAVWHNMNGLFRLAHAEKCSRITCISPRRGFAKWASKFGFTLMHSAYVLKV
jgi:hypothetical protein